MKRFFDKVNKTESCWLWTASKRSGYGCIKVGRKLVGAHVFSYQLHKGEIKNGLLVCHTCDTPTCVNPDHLFLGTNQDNMIDAMKKGRLKNLFLPGQSGGLIEQHPSLSSYISKKCRCIECKKIVSDYMKERYKKNKQLK